ncbi:MAG: outer membrane protein OmpA-like peptidoglycan-associated protein [Flavobacteriales bacterium]|jgi:outer membrane protein OmpA-like peptidoglycan-associated protein
MLVISGCNTPKSKFKLADRYFQEFEFTKAAEIYEDVLEKYPEDTHALRQAAVARENLGDYKKSEEHLEILAKSEAVVPADLLEYAEMLKLNGNYEKAIDVYRGYAELKPEDKSVRSYIDQPGWLNILTRDSANYTLTNSAVNTEGSDFAPAFIDNEIFFSSSRAEGKGKRNIYAWNDQSYLNLYSAQLGADSTLDSPAVLKNKANSRFHEGTATYDANNKRLYFTRNYFDKGKQQKSDDGALNLAIFYASYENGEVGKIKEFKYNNSEYSVGHPTLSEDGNTMYYVSDNPVGKGGTDLYKVTRESTGWSKPELLGDEMNTLGNEMFPFLLNDSTLLFSSDRLPGMGGLDIFEADLSSDPPHVRNLGYPVNSHYDDFGITMNKHRMSGYISSNRPSGKGDDDIYHFSVTRPSTVIISGDVVDVNTLEPLPFVIITLKNPDGTLLEVAQTDANGHYEFETDHSEVVAIRATKNGYFPVKMDVRTNEYSKFMDEANIVMVPYDHLAEGTVLYAENDLPAQDARITLFNADETILEQVVTGDDGKYSFALMTDQEYTIECSKLGYPDQEVILITNELTDSLIHADFRLFKLETGAIVRMDNIYYDYNSSDIRSDAGRELDKLHKIMRDNPTMKIELGSHTDSRGPGGYNLSLSKKRAKSAANYLIEQGISSSRVKNRGYGERNILNKCKDDVDCSEDEHQMNRRTEFKILEI